MTNMGQHHSLMNNILHACSLYISSLFKCHTTKCRFDQKSGCPSDIPVMHYNVSCIVRRLELRKKRKKNVTKNQIDLLAKEGPGVYSTKPLRS
jgi:hypothetical protein